MLLLRARVVCCLCARLLLRLKPIFIYICIHAYIYIYMHICIHTYIYAYMHIYINMCVCVCVCVCVCILRGAAAATRGGSGRKHPHPVGAKLRGKQRRSAPPCQKARLRKSQYIVTLSVDFICSGFPYRPSLCRQLAKLSGYYLKYLTKLAKSLPITRLAGCPERGHSK